MKKNNYYKVVSCVLAAATCLTASSCSECDVLTAAAAGSAAIALIPSVDGDTRTVAAIAAPILGAFAFNCYRANAVQQQQAKTRAKQLQKTYVSKTNSGKSAQQYYAVPVKRDKTVVRKFKVDDKVDTKEVIIVDAKTGQAEPTVYEIKRDAKKINMNNKDILVDI